MRVLSVNISMKPVRLPGMREATGIHKVPTLLPVRVHALELDGDSVCCTKHHGGPDQAVYLYGQPDYDWWSNELREPLAAGTFGENLTVSDLISADYNIGDRFHFDEVILEVTAPRIPCGTLAKRMKDPNFPEKFRAAERPGLYCRVIRAGEIRSGETLMLKKFAGPIVPVIELFRSFYRNGEEPAQTLRWHLSAPIAIRARNQKESQLRTVERP
jgi:MOSC domain-containing protein YiiM